MIPFTKFSLLALLLMITLLKTGRGATSENPKEMIPPHLDEMNPLLRKGPPLGVSYSSFDSASAFTPSALPSSPSSSRTKKSKKSSDCQSKTKQKKRPHSSVCIKHQEKSSPLITVTPHHPSGASDKYDPPDFSLKIKIDKENERKKNHLISIDSDSSKKQRTLPKESLDLVPPIPLVKKKSVPHPLLTEKKHSSSPPSHEDYISSLPLFETKFIESFEYVDSGQYAHVYKVQFKGDDKHYAIKFFHLNSPKSWFYDVEFDKVINHLLSDSSSDGSKGNSFILKAAGKIKIPEESGQIEFNTETYYFGLLFPFISRPLSFFMDNSNKLPFPILKACVYQILKGLEFLHGNHIAHVDIKPWNILTSYEPPATDVDSAISEDRLKKMKLSQLIELAPTVIIDGSNFVSNLSPLDNSFKLLDNRRPSIAYEAPEIVLGNSLLTSAVDIWSLGILIIDCLFRKNIFSLGRPFTSATCLYHIIPFVNGLRKEIYTSSKTSSANILSCISEEELVLVGPKKNVESFRINYEQYWLSAAARAQNSEINPAESIIIQQFKLGGYVGALKKMLGDEFFRVAHFIVQLLEFDPAKRITASVALQHLIFSS